MADADEEQEITQPVYVTTGPAWIAGLKVQFGKWLEERRDG